MAVAPASRLHEERIADDGAQLPQKVGYRGLGHAQARRGAHHRAFLDHYVFLI
jgi:hypothetical protein